MFALRSSPSSLVCDIRDGWAATSTAVISAPRPIRAAVRLIYPHYDSQIGDRGSDGGSGSASGGGGRGALSPVSDYAGVFEAGFDPAQVRASMAKEVVEVATTNEVARPGVNELPSEAAEERGPFAADMGGVISSRSWCDPAGNRRAAQKEESEPAAGGRGDGVADGAEEVGDEVDEEIEFLFDMEGLKEPSDQQEEESSSSNTRAAVVACGRGGSWGATAAGRGFTGSNVAPKEIAPPRTTVPSPEAVREAFAGFKGAAALRTPRVIAPRGTRCVGGGMYRLRLCTSC